MRHQIGYIALSLLAAAFTGCSSADNSTSTTSGSGKDALTGALAKYNAAIVPLANACTWTSVASGGLVAGEMSVKLAQDDVAQISVRIVDKALLVNGQTCADTATTSNKGVATSALVKKLTVSLASAASDGDETVIIDTRNGQFALAGSTAATGIQLSLGAGSDIVAIAGSTGADKFGCIQSSGVDTLGIKSATSKDIIFSGATSTPAGVKFIVDLSDGADQFDQNNCVATMSIYGGLGSDIINVGASTSTGDLFSGGSDPSGTDKDVLSFAARTSTSAAMAMVINLTTIPVTTSLNAASNTPAGPFAMAALTAGVSGEADTLVDDFETITGSSADDFILSGSNTSTYTLNGGPGNDNFATLKAHGATMNGGDGIDTANYSARCLSGATSCVTATMGAAGSDGETGDADVISLDVENYRASNFGDTVTGSAVNNVFWGGLGNDSFSGLAGDDTYMAASSTGPDGNDIFNGGTGDDTADYSTRTPGTKGVYLILDGSATSGEATYTGSTSTASWTIGTETDTLATDVENAFGTAGRDHLVGNTGPNVLLGFGAANGFDQLDGLAGNDQLDDNSYTATLNSNSSTTMSCNPLTLGCLQSTSLTCTCSSPAATLGTPTTPTYAIFNCGGDPLDVASGAGGNTYVGCAIKQ